MPASSTRTPRETPATPTRTKPKGGGGLFVFVLFGLLVIGGGIFALIYFLSDSPKPDNEMLAYLPAESTVVIGIDVEESLKSPKTKGMALKFIGYRIDPIMGEDLGFVSILKRVNLSEKDIARIAIGARDWQTIDQMLYKGNAPAPTNPDANQFSVVIRMKQPIDKAKLVEAMGGREQKKGEKTYYALGPRMAIAFPSDSLIVVTSQNDKLLDKILNADPGKPAISAEMMDLVKRSSRGHMWFAMQRRALQETTYIGIKESNYCPFLTNETAEALKGMTGVGGWFKFDGDQARFTVSADCGDVGNATRAADKLNSLIEQQRDLAIDKDPRIKSYSKTPKGNHVMPADWEVLGHIQRSASVALSGNTIEFSAEIPAESVETLFELITKPARPASTSQQKGPGTIIAPIGKGPIGPPPLPPPPKKKT